ncbi:hypothetical protein Dimus_022485 [Dionaea muscipula]
MSSWLLILDVHWKKLECCEYIEEVWEESRETLEASWIDIFGSSNGKEVSRYARVMMRHMSYVISMKDHELPYGDWLTLIFEAFGLTRENGIWWIGSGENRRRDDDGDAPEVEAEGEDEGNKDDFQWEAVIDEATVEGESGSGEKFYDAEEEAQGSPDPHDEIQRSSTKFSSTKDEDIARVDPSGPTSERS